jgi:hypothetical protein
MREFSVQDDHCPCGHFEWDKVFYWVRKRGVIEFVKVGAIVIGPETSEHFAQWRVVTTWCGPQTAVFKCCVFNCEPKPSNREWVGVQERGVLVAANLSADSWLFEDVHALQSLGVSHPNVGRNTGEV